MGRFLIFIIGVVLSVFGLSFIIIYLNLLIMGYTFWDYLYYIFHKIECLSFFVGYLLVLLSIYGKGRRRL